MANAQVLKSHQWKHRIILLFAEHPDSDSLLKQGEELESSDKGVKERDLVVYRLFMEKGMGPSGKPLDREKAEQLRHIYNIPKTGFTFLLIGKDGTEKLRRRAVVPVGQLFNVIDRMPMRQAEMRRKNNQ